MVNCPSCGSEKFYYIQRAWEYHRANDVESDGSADLSHLSNWSVDDSVQPYFECEHEQCKKKFKLVPHVDYAMRFEEIINGQIGEVVVH